MVLELRPAAKPKPRGGREPSTFAAELAEAMLVLPSSELGHPGDGVYVTQHVQNIPICSSGQRDLMHELPRAANTPGRGALTDPGLRKAPP